MSKHTYHQTKMALGSDVSLNVVTDRNQANVETYFNSLWQSIFMFERQFSRFLPLSELSQFNQQAGSRQVISNEFQDILRASSRLSFETKGLHNPFILPVLQRVGYATSFVGDYGDEPEINFSNRTLTTSEKLQIGDNWAMIPYGTAIDLGGCGKGYLGDTLASSNMPDWVSGYWFSFGGDVVGGGFDEMGQPWLVEIKDTLDANLPAVGQFINTKDSFHIATSSIKERRGTRQGKKWHHIIDPRTRLPADTDIVTATVAADTLILADVLATSAIILGSQDAPEFLSNLGMESALFGLDNGIGNTTYRNYGKFIHTYEMQKVAVA